MTVTTWGSCISTVVLTASDLEIVQHYTHIVVDSKDKQITAGSLCPAFIYGPIPTPLFEEQLLKHSFHWFSMFFSYTIQSQLTPQR
jgi:hypothetical protein